MSAAPLRFRFALLTALAVAWLMVPPARAQNLPLTALPFLEISPSPAVNAVGGAGVALAEPDAYGAFYNPASLGLTARDARALTALYPGGTTDWLAVGDLTLGSAALAAGFGAHVAGRPLAVGVGLEQTVLRYGQRVAVNGDGAVIGSYEPTDRSRSLAVGVATTGAARLGLGASAHHVVSTDQVLVDETGLSTTNIWGFTFDVGVLAEADVTRLLGGPRLGAVAPALTVSAGYAQTNLGGKVTYSGSQAMPLPRTARLGWSARAGLDLPTARGAFRLVEGLVTVQAEHSLVRFDERHGGYRYRATLGDLDVVQNGLLGHGSDSVTGRSGWRLTLGETLAVSRGGFDGWGFSDAQTHGTEVRLAGLLKGAALLTGADRLTELASQFDLRLTRSVVFAGQPQESRFSGVTLVVRR